MTGINTNGPGYSCPHRRRATGNSNTSRYETCLDCGALVEPVTVTNYTIIYAGPVVPCPLAKSKGKWTPPAGKSQGKKTRWN